MVRKYRLKLLCNKKIFVHYVSVKTEAECNFDKETTCNFQVDIGGTLPWKIQRGIDSGPSVQRPQYDHTKMSSKFRVGVLFNNSTPVVLFCHELLCNRLMRNLLLVYYLADKKVVAKI